MFAITIKKRNKVKQLAGEKIIRETWSTQVAQIARSQHARDDKKRTKRDDTQIQQMKFCQHTRNRFLIYIPINLFDFKF